MAIKPPKENQSVDDADWLEKATQTPVGCTVCRLAGPRVRALLELAKTKGLMRRLSGAMLYARICEVVPGFKDEIGFRGFQKHLTLHEPIWRAQ